MLGDMRRVVDLLGHANRLEEVRVTPINGNGNGNGGAAALAPSNELAPEVKVPRYGVSIVAVDGYWVLVCAHCRSSIFDGLERALDAAREHVGLLPEGVIGRIEVLGAEGDWRVEWVLGRDAHPPQCPPRADELLPL